ncbi:MAG: PorV/PorQ family protein [Candidatus Desantisbacteria bacterium]
MQNAKNVGADLCVCPLKNTEDRRNNKIMGWGQCVLLFQLATHNSQLATHLCLLALLFLPTIIFAEQNPDAGQPGYFLKLATGADILAMGGAGVACPDSGIFINSAGIAINKGKNLQISSIALPFPDTSYNLLSYTQRVGTNWGIGFGLPVLKITGAEKRTSEYDKSSGTFDDQHMALGLGVARRFASGLSFGLTLKAMQQKFDEKTIQSSDADVGMIYQHRSDHPISMGISIQNILGSTIKQVVGIDKMPRTIMAGVSYSPVNRAFLTVEMQKVNGQALRTCLGGEYSPIKPLSLRAGYDEQGCMTAGMGLQLKNIALDYGLQNHRYKLSVSSTLNCR